MNIVAKGNNWLGDAVMSLPALRSLKEMHPRSRLAVLTKRSLASLYRGAPYVDEIIPYDSWAGAVRSVKRRFDTAVIFPRSFKSAMMMFSARIKRRIGYRGEGRSLLLTDAVTRMPDLLKIHRVHYYHHLLHSLGVPPKPKAPHLSVPQDAKEWAEKQLGRGPFIGINPGATYGVAKQWYPDRFIETGRRLAKHGRPIIVGGPGEAELGARVAREIPDALSVAGRTDLLQLAAVIARCRLFLTNDTGPMHVADALGIPIVAIFGPTDWITTPPFGRRHTIVRKEIECSPCLKRECPLRHHNCMKWIGVDEVFAACESWLKA